MRIFGRVSTLAVVALGLTVAAARAGEEKIPIDQVPKKALDAFKAKFPKTTIKNAIKEDDAGKVTYEIESVQDGLAIDAVLKADGEFVNIEKEIKVSSVPAVVTKAVAAKYPKSKIKKAEELTEGEKFNYELLVETSDGKTAEVVVSKDGKVQE